MASTIDIERSNVTVLGQFNVGILRPAWLKEQSILGDEQVGILVSEQQDHPMYYVQAETDPWGWFVLRDRLIAFGGLGPCSTFVARILETLEHTPVSAAGVNLRRLLPANMVPKSLIGLLPTPEETGDAVKFANGTDAGAVSSAIRINREDGSIMGLTLTQADGGILISANFHRDSNNSPDLIKHVGGATEMETDLDTLLDSQS